LLDKSLGKINPTFLSDIGPYYLWRAKGNNELLFLGDVEAAKQSYQKSKEWAKAIGGADSERMIEINQRSINFLDSNPNSKNARVGAWVSILANQHDKKTAEKIIQQIKQLGAKIEVNEDGTIKIIVNANQD
jgi:fructose-1,6-bisphosphatase/sedoheptulose 1,7-bisphosphatase-like protein